MTTEELMRPRFKVIADYPGSKHQVGKIYIKMDGREFYENIETGMAIGFDPKYYENIFRPLAWWEDRELPQMPEYLKRVKVTPFMETPINSVIKVNKWFIDEDGKDAYFTWEGNNELGNYPSTYSPATKQEYQSFINNQNQ
jgi:hypothetical protein